MYDFQKLFKEAVMEVWNIDYVLFQVAPGLCNGNLASLSFDTNSPLAVDRKLIRHASQYVLNVSERLVVEPDDIVRKVLLHEAIHVGIPMHDEHFERVAAQVGTNSTERAMRGLGVLVEREDPVTRQLSAVLETFDRAEAFRFAETRAAGLGRYKITW